LGNAILPLCLMSLWNYRFAASCDDSQNVSAFSDPFHAVFMVRRRRSRHKGTPLTVIIRSELEWRTR